MIHKNSVGAQLAAISRREGFEVGKKEGEETARKEYEQERQEWQEKEAKYKEMLLSTGQFTEEDLLDVIK